MKLAFCLFNYFPYGGLQRDFLRIARACKARGHDIRIYTMYWESDEKQNNDVDIRAHCQLINISAWQNHTRSHLFAEQVKAELNKDPCDLVVGFNKMPYLDVYYAADVCYQARVHAQRNAFYQWLPRYRQYVSLERAVFARGNATKILLISPLQQKEYVDCYQTEAERFHLLTPGIDKDRIAPLNAGEIRKKIRNTYYIPADHFLLLMVGSGFKTKGLDRAIRAVAALPSELKTRCHLLVIGQDHANSFQQLAKRLHVADLLHFLGGRSDVPSFLLAADLLLHPAYHENTGTVLLEAMIAGLPVLTTDVCGYAHYVHEANAGIVLSSPFQQAKLNHTLAAMLLSPERLKWQQNGLAFANEADIYSMPEKAANFIEEIGESVAKKRQLLSTTAT